MKEEEDDYVQVIFSHIEPYQDEPLAEDDSAGEGNEVDEEADEDEDGDYSSPLRDRETSCPEGLVIDMCETSAKQRPKIFIEIGSQAINSRRFIIFKGNYGLSKLLFCQFSFT